MTALCESFIEVFMQHLGVTISNPAQWSDVSYTVLLDALYFLADQHYLASPGIFASRRCHSTGQVAAAKPENLRIEYAIFVSDTLLEDCVRELL